MLLATALTTIALLSGLLTDTVEEVSQQTPLPILISDNFYSDFDPLYPSGSGDRRSYSIRADAGPRVQRRQRLLRRRLPRREGRQAVRARQGDADEGPQGPLPAAQLRRLVLTAVDLLEGARRDLHDPGQGGRREVRPAAADQDGQRGDQAGTAVGAASRSAAASTAPSRPGKRASTSSRRSDTWRCVPSARVCVSPPRAAPGSDASGWPWTPPGRRPRRCTHRQTPGRARSRPARGRSARPSRRRASRLR